MSAKAPPRCKVCKALTKGHKGKTGVGNCTNPVEGEGARRSIVGVLLEQDSYVKKRNEELDDNSDLAETTDDMFEDAEEEEPSQRDLENEQNLYLLNKHLSKLQVSSLPPRKKSVFSVTDDEACSTPLPEAALACSFELPSFTVARREEEGRVSRSEDVDVRKLLAGKMFTFCVCNIVSF